MAGTVEPVLWPLRDQIIVDVIDEGKRKRYQSLIFGYQKSGVS